MLVGIPREIKNHEYRVGLTPAGVRELVANGHQVLVEANAGKGIGFEDSDYTACGAAERDGPPPMWVPPKLSTYHAMLSSKLLTWYPAWIILSTSGIPATTSGPAGTPNWVK